MMNRVKYMEMSAGRGVLEVCENLHMACTGAADFHYSDMDKDSKALVFAIQNWEPNPITQFAVYDQIVKSLIFSVLNEYRQFCGERRV